LIDNLTGKYIIALLIAPGLKVREQLSLNKVLFFTDGYQLCFIKSGLLKFLPSGGGGS